jgi:hypothetical protein
MLSYMMVLSVLRPDAGLFEFLAHRARSATVRRLGLDVALGATAVAAVFTSHPPASLFIASAATVLFSYGAWGLLDRGRSILSAKAWSGTASALDALGALSALLGVLAAGGVLLAVWGAALGTWIS